MQFYKVHNHLTDEDIVMPRLVNQQLLDFNALCEYLADGSTVTAADVAAVMKQIEMRLPLVLGLNAKVVCSPEGLTFRPKVSGSITQSQLKAKLEAKLAADPTLEIDVNRALTVSDLTVNDIVAEIAIELPKKWTERFQSTAEFKRINKDTAEALEILQTSAYSDAEMISYQQYWLDVSTEKSALERERKEGRAEGEKAKAIAIARNAKQMGLTIENISLLTGLGLDEIETL